MKAIGQSKRTAIYVLAHGIEVLAEVAPSHNNPYWRIYIKAHPLFSAKVNKYGNQLVRRNRAIMTSIVGRVLGRNEHVHHSNEDRTDDSPCNLELLTAGDHNTHHHLGLIHSEEAKSAISISLKGAYATGKRRRPFGIQTFKGKKHSDNSLRKMSETKKKMIANGEMKKPIPPSWKGKKHSPETIEKMRASRLAINAKRKKHEDSGI